MPTFKQVEYMALPRMSALSEIAWTNTNNKNFEKFKSRLNNQYKRFDAMGSNYFRKGH